MGAAMIGVSNWNASIDQLTETSSGSRVRRVGTMAMSSNAYTRRARLARPISSSFTSPAYARATRPSRRMRVECFCAAEMYRNQAPARQARRDRECQTGTMHVNADPIESLRRRTSMKWAAFPPDVLPLPVAEMDFPLAEPIASVLIDAIKRSDTGYAPPTSDLPPPFARVA